MVFFILSIYTNFELAVYALLLLDIITKIKTLTQVFSIFGEISQALASTAALFLVLLYIYSFLGFKSFRNFFDEENNLNCETLTDCLVSTIDMGLRSGGGIGDVLNRPDRTKSLWNGMYIYNLTFFLFINIILMNIFFGIIIDAFAAKRDATSEINIEVNDQCFICGIKKSVFEIEN